jgi:Flp pilus assembly protein TadG
MSANVQTPSRERERGQIIVIFALALIAIIAMVGLVLDGGSAFAQRRDEQSAADLAALAAANDYMLNSDAALARTRARTVAAANGYTHGTGGVVVNVTITIDNGAEAQVDISAPHRNNFASVVGMPTWDVATTAKAQAGYPDTANGAGPMIFSIDAFGPSGQPLAAYGDPNNPYDFGETNGDIPSSAGDLAWTNYGTGNVDSSAVREIIVGDSTINKTIAFGEYIGQHNNGNHSTLFGDMDDNLAGQNVPVPVVDHNGNFQGWATFHVISGDQSGKQMKGYFVSPFVNKRLTIKACGFGGCPRYLGSPTINLVN